jgi:hypothetical protein
VSACNQRERKRGQEKMQDRYAQRMPRPLAIDAAGVEEPPAISGGYDQAE